MKHNDPVIEHMIRKGHIHHVEKLVIKLIDEMFNEHDFDPQGHRVNGGADYYQCTSCMERTITMGYASFSGNLGEVNHAPNCRIVKLLNLLNKLKES